MALRLAALVILFDLAGDGSSVAAEVEVWPPGATAPEAVFETIQAAIDSLPSDPAGYTVQIGGGAHHEAVRIRDVHGKPGQPVTITRRTRDPLEAVIDGAIPGLEARWEVADPGTFGPNVYLTRAVAGSRRVVTASYRGGPKDGVRLWTYGLAEPTSGSGPAIDPLLVFKERANPLLHPPVPPHGICYDSRGILYAALPPGEDPRANAPLSVSRADFVLSIEASSHLHLKDLHLRNGGEATLVVRDGSFSNVIENVTVRGGHRGIFFKLSDPSNDNVVRGCRLVETYDPSWYWTDFKDEVHRLHDDRSLESFVEFEVPKMMEGTGIAFSVGDDNVVEDCDVQGYFDGIGQTSVQSRTRRLRIRRNTVHGIPDGAIQIHGEASAAEVHHNLVFDVHTAISMAPTMAPPIDGEDSPAHVYRNRLLATRILRYARHPRLPGDAAEGKHLVSPAVFKIRGTYPEPDDSSNTRIHHNTCFSMGDGVAGGRRDLSRDIQLHDNIFQSGAPCDGTRLVSHSGLAADGIVFEGNLYHRLFPCDLILNWNFVSTQGSTDRDYPDLASARASAEGRSAGWESRGVDSLDPGFRDPANHDLGLAPGSPALDAGVPLPYASPDSTRIERLPDIGAIESADADPGGFFRRGDSNGDGAVDLSDGIFLALRLYAGGEAPACLDAADADDDGSLGVSDVIAVLSFLFRGGIAPAFPGPGYCGPDPTGADALTCARYESAACRLPLPEAPAG